MTTDPKDEAQRFYDEEFENLHGQYVRGLNKFTEGVEMMLDALYMMNDTVMLADHADLTTTQGRRDWIRTHLERLDVSNRDFWGHTTKNDTNKE